MKKILISLITVLFVVSMIFTVVSCKTEAAVEEEVTPAEEEAAVEEEVSDETVTEEVEEVIEPEMKEIALHFQPNVLFAPTAVAIDKGWFEEAGFEKVDKKSFTAGALAGEALVGGEIQNWIPGNMPVISMRHNGIPIVITGCHNNFPHSEYLMVRNDAGVENPEDLLNIKIALLQGSTASAVLAEVAKEYGLDVNEMGVVNLAPPEQVTALKNNDVQAIVVWPPFKFQVEDIATYMFNSTDLSRTNTPIVFSEEFIRNNPNTGKVILKVLYKAMEFCEDPANKDEAVEIFARIAEQSVEDVEAAWNENWDPAIKNGFIDERFVEDMEIYTEFQLGIGSISEPVINVLDYTYTGILKDIAPEYVKVEGNWTP